MASLVEVAERAARAAGSLLLEYQAHIVGREKGPRDLVSDADLASQRCIRTAIHAAFPEHGFLGEEDDPQFSSEGSSEYRWIVDPLDGTTNYLHRLPAFAVSIAVEHRGELVAGVVYDPTLNECFSAEVGHGAWMNGRRLRTSAGESPGDALVAASFSPVVPADSVEITRFLAALQACQGVRRLGSAALNLAYVAAGRLDAYWATSVKIWDVAAGLLLVREAGGVVTHVEGGLLDHRHPELLAAANSKLSEQMTGILNPRR